MNELSVQIRVTSIRSRGKFGGVIFSGRDNTGALFVVVCERNLAPDPMMFDKGQTWAITGKPRAREIRTPSGFTFTEQEITAQTALLVQPAGHNLIAWISESSQTPGIGRVKAQRLYDRFGLGLINLLEEECIEQLAQIVGSTAAQTLCDAFRKQSLAASFSWLDQIGVESDGRLQSAGCYVIENYIAERCREIQTGEDKEGRIGFFTTLAVNVAQVANVNRQFEQENGIRLTPEQCDAIFTCLTSNLSLILGGAGTGKTTVLRALFAAIDALLPGTRVFQMALAGLAAKRMAEATGRESLTIAAFLARTKPCEIEPDSIVVVDEASMVDTVLMYRLLRHLPPWIRLVLVGDPAQLPPIGPGVVLHSLAGLMTVPQTELKTVLRHSTESGIPQIASAIRAHLKPNWKDSALGSNSGVSFIQCDPWKIADMIQDLYKQLGGAGSDYSVQILSITNGGAAGVRDLNRRFHDLFQSKADVVELFDQEQGVSPATTLDGVPFAVGDLVMFTENDYKLDLRNGSLGRILRRLTVAGTNDPCCVAEFDGIPVELNSRHMNMLVHSYAISVHKAQGNEFRRVIVAVKQSRLLDQALLYTAVTRGVQQVVLVGDESVALRTISAPASSHQRHTGLSDFIAKRLAGRSPQSN